MRASVIRKIGLLVVGGSHIRGNKSRPNVRLVTRQEKSRSQQIENCGKEGQNFVQFTPGYYVLNEILPAMRFHHLECISVGASLSNLNDTFYTLCGFKFVRQLRQVSPEGGIINIPIHTYWEHCRSRQMCDAHAHAQ